MLNVWPKVGAGTGSAPIGIVVHFGHVAFFTGVVFSTSCGAGSDSDWRGRVYSDGGVRVTENPPEPLYPAGTLHGNPFPNSSLESAHWFGPSTVRATKDRLYVLDPSAHRVHEFSNSGLKLNEFGSKGGGPGEFESPRLLTADGSGAHIYDSGKGAIQVFHDGEYQESLGLSHLIFDMWMISEHSLLLEKFLNDTTRWVRARLDELPQTEDLALQSFGAMTPTDADPCVRVSAREGRILRLSCYVLNYAVLDSAGEAVSRVLVRGSTPRELKGDDRRRLEEQARKRIGAVGLSPELARDVLQRAVSRYRVVPRFQGIRMDETTGRVFVWEEDPPEIGPDVAVIHVFDSGGIYVTSFETRHSWVDFDVCEGRIFALAVEPETGLRNLRVYSLPEEPGGPHRRMKGQS